MQHHFPVHFTVPEVQSMLPGIREVFARLHRLLNEPLTVIRNDDGELEFTSLVPRRSFEKEGPYPQPLSLAGLGLPSTEEGRRAEADRILKLMMKRGIIIQDIHRGLIDFPFVADDEREVLLCYQLADGDRLDWYHDLTAGFAGRHRLPEHWRHPHAAEPNG